MLKLVDNIQWIFSGIGVLAISLIIKLIVAKKNKRDKKGIIIKNTKRTSISKNKNISRILVNDSADIKIEGNENV